MVFAEGKRDPSRVPEGLGQSGASNFRSLGKGTFSQVPERRKPSVSLAFVNCRELRQRGRES